MSFSLSLAGGSLASAVDLPGVVRAVAIKPGATRAVPLPFAVPAGLAAGSYTLTVTLSPTTNPADVDAADKSVVASLVVVG